VVSILDSSVTKIELQNILVSRVDCIIELEALISILIGPSIRGAFFLEAVPLLKKKSSRKFEGLIISNSFLLFGIRSVCYDRNEF